MITLQKRSGAFYTPEIVAETLVRWAVRRQTDRMLDPSCGDGRFLTCHSRVVGVERDPLASATAMQRAPWAEVHEADFFDWVNRTKETFECVAGNPPFIRYQLFSGAVRARALTLCQSMGVEFSSLTSSWAPFLVAACAMLAPGGRMAFVVPAEIGHAPYAKPLLRYLCEHFETVQLVAIREKLFPQLSEDAWLLFANGYGGEARAIRFTAQERFRPSPSPPRKWTAISLEELAQWNYRLRPFLLPDVVRRLYASLASNAATAVRMNKVAQVGIGYVTGANDFFHLRPSVAAQLGINGRFTQPAVRSARGLPLDSVTKETVDQWIRADRPALLLRLRAGESLPPQILRYLDSPQAHEVRTGYKCRNREPWYVVPDVRTPDAFLSYMSGKSPALVANKAGCACSNAVHAVTLLNGTSVEELQSAWRHPLTQLSCELEGHPLGGGMLKLEPREAGRVALPLVRKRFSRERIDLLGEGIATMRRWRHYG